MPQGFEVVFPDSLFQEHKQFATFGLKIIWQFWRFWFKGEHEVAVQGMRVLFTGGKDPLSLILLPFTLLHESLHFILLWIHGNKHLVRLGPGILEIFYLSFAFQIYIRTPWAAFFFLFIDTFQLMRNLRGDFVPYLPKLKRQTDKPDRKDD
jgi:hypothetical protein